MSILQQNRLNLQKRGLFCAITGKRLAGKSTLAGTLPGKTAMLTAALFETGSGSATALAKELGNELDVFTFNSIGELKEMITEASKSYNNIYIDSATGVTELVYRSPKIVAALKKNTWDAFREIADIVEDLMLHTKALTEQSELNIFYSISLIEKDGVLVPEAKGNAVVKNIRAIFPVVLALRPEFNEDGESLEPSLITKTTGEYGARIDDLLAANNPGILPADLSKVIDLLKK